MPGLLTPRGTFGDMGTLMDENQILTQSIGEHAVAAVNGDRLHSLTVTFDARDARCVIAFVLEDNSDEEQLRAIDKLLDVQMLFMDEASIEFRIDDASDSEEADDRHSVSQRQYSFA